jgi:hypothetical protein
MTLEVNRPDVVTEIWDVFTQYEGALGRHDADLIDSWFWPDERVVRYGVAECLYGIGAIVAWRRTASPVPLRRLHHTVVNTFGTDCAVVDTEFAGDDGRAGRQSQTWVRMGDRWQIVSAHVSFMSSS